MFSDTYMAPGPFTAKLASLSDSSVQTNKGCTASYCVILRYTASYCVILRHTAERRGLLKPMSIVEVTHLISENNIKLKTQNDLMGENK